MRKTFTGLRCAVGLTGVALVLLVVGGIYTALDSAGSLYAKPAQANAVELQRDKPAIEKDAPKSNAHSISTSDSVNARGVSGGGLASPGLPDSGEGQDASAVDASEKSASALAAIETQASGAGSATSAPPAVTNNSSKKPIWVEAVYDCVEHDAVTDTILHDAIYKSVTDYYTCCSDCSYKVMGSIYPHQDATGHARYKTEVPIVSQVLVREAWNETVVVKEAWTETVLVSEGYWS